MGWLSTRIVTFSSLGQRIASAATSAVAAAAATWSLPVATSHNARTVVASSRGHGLSHTAYAKAHYQHHHRHLYSGIRALHNSTPPSLDTNEPMSPQNDDSISEDENDTIEIIVSLPTDNAETTTQQTTPNDVNATTVLSIPGAQKGGRKLALVYTCTICDTRSVKQFTERAYRHGVVIVTCPKCRRQHLIADHLGYFDEKAKPFDLAATAAAKGHVMVVHNDATQPIRLEDLVGRDQLQQIIDTAESTKAAAAAGAAADSDATSTHKS
jgi:DNL zinc finger